MSIIEDAPKSWQDLTPTEQLVKTHMMLFGLPRITPDIWCPRDFCKVVEREPYPFMVCNPITLERVKVYIRRCLEPGPVL